MSVGCAIVASDTQPLHEAIKQDETGQLVDFFDVPGLAKEVCQLLDDPESRQRLGANARAFAQANYDLKTVCLPRQLEWVEGLAMSPVPAPQPASVIGLREELSALRDVLAKPLAGNGSGHD